MRDQEKLHGVRCEYFLRVAKESKGRLPEASSQQLNK